jgi:hypothetical protein
MSGAVRSHGTHVRAVTSAIWFHNKVMTMTGEGPGQEGKTAKYKSITEITDADMVNFVLFMVEGDGKEQPMVKITYKRKK